MLDFDNGAERVLGKFVRNSIPRDMHLRPLSVELSDEPGWQSAGGRQGAPTRAFPSSLIISSPKQPVERVHVVGVFSLFSQLERAGTRGASIGFFLGERQAHLIELVNGRHYRDANKTDLLDFGIGDGSHVSTIGCVYLENTRVRLDVLSIDVPKGLSFDKLLFRDLGTEASFVIYDVIFDLAQVSGCPFHSKSGGVSLADLAGIVRIRDRVRFQKAVEQVHAALDKSADLEEARSEALTFLAVVTAGMLEAGGSKALHRVQLDAARAYDSAQSLAELKTLSETMIDRVVGDWLHTEESQPKIIDRALSLVDRNFALDLTDDDIAGQIGLSTSHFRFLFKQSVGQPFHKFLIATRLEKAKIMLERGQGTVSEVSQAVGFNGLASFSRAFTQRFGVSPSEFKKARRL